MDYLLIFCALAVGHALFMAVALLTLNRKLSNRLLAVLLLLLAVRIGKSVLQLHLAPGMSYAASTAGVMAMACIGPVLLLLVNSLFSTAFRITLRHAIHFVPAAILPAFLFSGWKQLAPVYYTITLQVVVYVAVSWIYLFKNRATCRVDDLRWKWAVMLLCAISILAATFILQVTVYQPLIYTTNVIMAALLFYGLSLWAIRQSRLFLAEPSARMDNVALLNDLGERIQQLFDREHIYTESALTVSTLAVRVKAPPYLVSRAINRHFSKTFSELVLAYRLKRAEQLLLAQDSKLYTVEAIAFESGFNTLSAFYAAFKRNYHTTPAQFREAAANPAPPA